MSSDVAAGFWVARANSRMIESPSMSQENKSDAPGEQPTPATPAAPAAEAPKKKKLTLDIDEVDVSEVLERKISA